MRRVLLRVLAQGPDPKGPSLQPHLLRPLPGENVQAGGGHPDSVLPPVSLDHLHPSQSDPARSPVGQHGYLGYDSRGDAGEGAAFGFTPDEDPTHQVQTKCVISFHSKIFLL